MSDLYDRDFYAWSHEQATLLRAGKLSAADIAHIAEEIETLGRSEKRELVSRLVVLLQHRLKWQFQPSHRGRSWQLSIDNAQHAITEHLADNPSLKSKLADAMESAYYTARRQAAIETGIELDALPVQCPWTFEQAMQDTP
jgi:hypothetical protein